jgi:hypothetical protein
MLVVPLSDAVGWMATGRRAIVHLSSGYERCATSAERFDIRIEWSGGF